MSDASGNRSFGAVLREQRFDAGLTQAVLAQRAGLAERTIQDLERGIARPRRETVRRLVAALKPPPDVRAKLEAVTPMPRDRRGLLDRQTAADSSYGLKDDAHARASGDSGAIVVRLSAGETGQVFGGQGRHHFPAPMTSFVGREREIEEIRHLLGSSRLLTLYGTGGVGKTRLAMQVGAELSREYTHGVRLVGLDALADPSFVPGAIASVLGVREQPGRPLTETLVAFLASRSLLLVLDNCEHLSEACAVLADRLLRACPRLTILATSRETLGVAGEVTWRVPSLSLPEPQRLVSVDRLLEYEAVRLFVERARFARTDFTLTDENAAAVVQICRELDGIPLAIELAATRVRGLAVEQIAQRLGDRFSLLTVGNRAAVPRHRTLRSLIDWSHELLSGPEQVLFRRVSVFAAGWTVEAAEGICAGNGIDTGQVLPLLLQLQDKSLVVADEQRGAVRYRLLETLRQYGSDRLRASGEEAVLRARHRDWFVGFVDRDERVWYGSGQAKWMDRLEIELGNLRAALEWCTLEVQAANGSAGAATAADAALRMCDALRRFWGRRAYFSEGRAWMEQALSLAGSAVRTPARAKLLMYLAVLWPLDGQAESSRRLLEEGVALGREIRDPYSIVVNLVGLGFLRQLDGALDDAYACFEEAVAVGREIERPLGLFMPRYWLAGVLRENGELIRARELLEEQLAVSRVQGDIWSVGLTRFGLALLGLTEGAYEQAEELFRQSLKSWHTMTDPLGITIGLSGIAWAAAARGHAGRAARLFGAEDALRERNGSLMLPLWQSDHARWQAAARAELGDEAFTAAWTEGQAMSLEQAVAYALEDHSLAASDR